MAVGDNAPGHLNRVFGLDASCLQAWFERSSRR
jgi:hypothetical protein